MIYYALAFIYQPLRTDTVRQFGKNQKMSGELIGSR